MDVDADARHRQQGRHQAQVRGAEPQPALVRRRRVAVRRLLRPAVVPDRRTSSAAAKPSACRCRGARRRGSTRSRSASRICSTGRLRSGPTSSPASTSSRCSTRRRRPAPTSSSALRSPITRGCSRATATSKCSVYDINPSYLTPAVLVEPVPARLAADRSGRPPHGQQDLAERRVQHGQPADFPDRRQAADSPSSTSPVSAGTPLLPDPARRHLVPAR